MPPMYFSSDACRDCGMGYGLGMDPAAGFQLPGSFYQIDTELLKKFMLNACTLQTVVMGCLVLCMKLYC